MKEEREVKRNTSYITGQVLEEDDDRCHGDMDRGVSGIPEGTDRLSLL